MAESVNNDTTATFKKGEFINVEMLKKFKHHADSVQKVISRLQKDSLELAKDVESLKQDGRDCRTNLNKLTITKDSLVNVNAQLQHTNDSLNIVLKVVHDSPTKDVMIARVNEVQSNYETIIAGKDAEIKVKDSIIEINESTIKDKETTIKARDSVIQIYKGEHFFYAIANDHTECCAGVFIVLVVAITIIILKRGLSISKGNAKISVGDKDD